eukprot:comp21070_c0_seq5/m.28376 comp21070_c0_seq5/g.28376  ORF comp21070_c0_seq5/g.28376 comp21070_c0_seq5/m.28376 type:complete len:135 (-) comp21070_c0_seq5:590-994(-)
MSSAITKVPWGRYCDKVVQDFGGGFVMGAVGGGLYHFVKGVGNSPGLRVGVGAGLNAMKKRAPVIGGNFAAYGGMFAVFEIGIAHARQKEDSINAIAAGFLTSGVLAWRLGAGPALKQAVYGGVYLQGCLKTLR